MTFADVGYAVAAGVATITLERPEKLNAARIGTLDELIAALDAADADDAVRVVVVTGSGRAFCAGTDLANGFGDLPMGGDPATGEGVGADVGGRVTLRLFAMNKPVLAAVNGVAAGFGATVLLAMDRRIAVTGARFVFPFTRRGIVAESCSSWFLPRLVGISTALDWMLSGRVIEAEEALDKGLVDELVAPEALLPRATAIAEEIATHAAPASIAFTRRLLWRMLGADGPHLDHDYESRALAALLAHPDAKEGVQSFLERRPPAFSGTATDAAAVLRRWWPD
jgi:enoyl-CoA hydratase/carnithine racemase